MTHCPYYPAFERAAELCGSPRKVAALRRKPKSRWTRADCDFAQAALECTIPVAAQGVGRPPRKLVSPARAAARIEARHGAVPAGPLPAHIEPYADYMAARAGRMPSPRDVIKAYTITRSSVQRGNLPRASLCRYYPEFEGLDASVRPEDAFARLLESKWGRRYLDAAERGRFDFKAARALADRMGCWGLTDTLMDDLRMGVELGGKAPALAQAYVAPRGSWVRFVREQVPGISAAKAGFFAALLGRGDTPTFDARELDLWEARPDKRDVLPEDVEALARRLEKWPLELPAEHEPFRQHLTHHALWDAYPASGAPTQTTHATVMHAMEFAGLGSLRAGSRPRAMLPPPTAAQARAFLEEQRGATQAALPAMVDDAIARMLGKDAVVQRAREVAAEEPLPRARNARKKRLRDMGPSERKKALRKEQEDRTLAHHRKHMKRRGELIAQLMDRKGLGYARKDGDDREDEWGGRRCDEEGVMRAARAFGFDAQSGSGGTEWLSRYKSGRTYAITEDGDAALPCYMDDPVDVGVYEGSGIDTDEDAEHLNYGSFPTLYDALVAIETGAFKGTK